MAGGVPFPDFRPSMMDASPISAGGSNIRNQPRLTDCVITGVLRGSLECPVWENAYRGVDGHIWHGIEVGGLRGWIRADVVVLG